MITFVTKILVVLGAVGNLFFIAPNVSHIAEGGNFGE